MQKINQLFNIYNKSSSSSDLSEFDIYTKININSKKEIPVISSKTENDGVFGYLPEPNIDTSKYTENTYLLLDGVNYFINKTGSITVSKDGMSGYMIERSSQDYPIYAITCHALILSPIDKGLNLHWFVNKFRTKFMAHNTNGENNHFGTSIYNEFEFDIPNNTLIAREDDLFNKLNIKLQDCRSKQRVLEKLLLKSLINVPGDEYCISDVLEYKGRNDSLTELGIYLNPPTTGFPIEIISGGGSLVGSISGNTENIKYISEKPILAVITRGRAGKLFYYNKGTYAGNTNAYPLFIKDTIKDSLNITSINDEIFYLQFLKFYLEPIFINISSNSDLGVFPLNEIFNKAPLKLPFPQYDTKLLMLISSILNANKKIEEYESFAKKIQVLLDKDIVYNP